MFSLKKEHLFNNNICPMFFLSPFPSHYKFYPQSHFPILFRAKPFSSTLATSCILHISIYSPICIIIFTFIYNAPSYIYSYTIKLCIPFHQNVTLKMQQVNTFHKPSMNDIINNQNVAFL
jgi:hypothetical protein